MIISLQLILNFLRKGLFCNIDTVVTSSTKIHLKNYAIKQMLLTLFIYILYYKYYQTNLNKELPVECRNSLQIYLQKMHIRSSQKLTKSPLKPSDEHMFRVTVERKSECIKDSTIREKKFRYYQKSNHNIQFNVRLQAN